MPDQMDSKYKYNANGRYTPDVLPFKLSLGQNFTYPDSQNSELSQKTHPVSDLSLGSNRPFLPRASQLHRTPLRGRTPLLPELRRSPPHFMRPRRTRTRFRRLLKAAAAVAIAEVAVVAVHEVVDGSHGG